MLPPPGAEWRGSDTGLSPAKEQPKASPIKARDPRLDACAALIAELVRSGKWPRGEVIPHYEFQRVARMAGIQINPTAQLVEALRDRLWKHGIVLQNERGVGWAVLHDDLVVPVRRRYRQRRIIGQLNRYAKELNAIDKSAIDEEQKAQIADEMARTGHLKMMVRRRKPIL